MFNDFSDDLCMAFFLNIPRHDGNISENWRLGLLTIPSSWTVVRGISASMSITLAIDAGMASYFGWGATGAAEGAGRDAARAAAIDGAAMFFGIISS